MAAGGTVITYGSVELYNVLTKTFEQEVTYDDSGTDAMYYTFRIRCTGFIHGLSSANLGVVPTSGDGLAGNNYLQIQSYFGTRQHFAYQIGATYNSVGQITSPGTTILVADPANIPGTTNINFKDVNNGPKVKVLSVTNISGNAAIRIELEFEICQVRCLADGSTQNNFGVLNNRWSVVDDIDQNFFTTRTFSGKLRASSSMVNVNAFRSLCVPPLQPGMRRDRMQFAASEDGLVLAYNITDKEVAFAPPAPATTWSARFSEEVQVQGMLGYLSHADITLGGDRYVDKQKLIAIAASMAEAKFQNGLVGADDNTYFVQNIMVVDEYTDNASLVHLRATARRVDASAKGILGLNSSFLGVPILGGSLPDTAPTYDPRFSRDARPGEAIELNGPISIVGAFTSFLQSPCLNSFGIASGIQGNIVLGNPQQAGLPKVTAVVNNGIKNDSSLKNYGSVNTDGMYETWHMETHHITKANRIQLPVANVTNTNTSNTGSLDQPSYWNGNPPPPGDTSVVIALAPPTTQIAVTAVGTRVGSPPTMPKPTDVTSPDSNGTTLRVASSETSVGNPTPTADGKYIHRVEVNIYYFALDVITGGAASFFTGINPWATVPVYKVGKGSGAPYQDTPRGNLTIPWDF